MGLINLLLNSPIAFFILMIPLLYSVIIHELSHGLIAYLFGDNTPKNNGRLSLNPLHHLDLLGTLSLFFIGFGWARPVPINPLNFRNIKWGIFFVSLAGPLSNLILAALSILLITTSIVTSHFFIIFLLIIAEINIILGVFNLIPLPPLDGSKILMIFLPFSWQRRFMRIEPWGIFLIIILFYAGLLRPLINFIINFISSILNIQFPF